jgi:hypothetical protein
LRAPHVDRPAVSVRLDVRDVGFEVAYALARFYEPALGVAARAHGTSAVLAQNPDDVLVLRFYS